MTDKNPELSDVFEAILRREGITSALETIEVAGFREDPGFHWSNPGLKSVCVTAGGTKHNYVVKRLGKHARREVLVCQFLSAFPDFPMPRLYHSVYDEESDDYWFVAERGYPRPDATKLQFWTDCATVLARIHAPFWDKLHEIPDVFRRPSEPGRAARTVSRLHDAITKLTSEESAVLETCCGSALSDLAGALRRIRPEQLPRDVPRARCLIHRAFHEPEITWRRAGDAYVPLAVDWESARAGAPHEDFRIAGQLLVKGETAFLESALETYFDEIHCHGVSLAREPFVADVHREALLDKMETLPWLMERYLERRDDPAFAKWRGWVTHALPEILAYARKAISDGKLYESE